ncbi:MAG: group 1 truncated hemoglobin [Sandaracinaceae bacterium]
MDRPTSPSAFDRLGGEARLRPIIDAFVDRVFDDVMIGFFFRRASRERIKELEYQHAAEHLGGPVTYRGRPLDVAHRPHRIFGGQFARRMRILEQVLEEHGVPDDVREAWLAHTASLRPLITGDAGSECIGRPLPTSEEPAPS